MGAVKGVIGGDKSTITVKGEGVGAVRDIQLATQGYVQHRLIAFDDENRMFSYQLTAGKPIGMQDYTVAATVIQAARTTILASTTLEHHSANKYPG